MLGIFCDGHSLHWSVDVGYSDVVRCGGSVYALWLRLIMGGDEGSETGKEGECKRMHAEWAPLVLLEKNAGCFLEEVKIEERVKLFACSSKSDCVITGKKIKEFDT